MTLDWYDVDAEYNATTNLIDNSVTQMMDFEVELDESMPVAVTVEPTVTPETLNLQGEGEWVNVTFEIPHEEIDVEDVNLSSLVLNEEVPAETDEQYGFVRNPVEDGVFKAKFPRDEVEEVLETGEGVRVTISGETDGGQLVVGGDLIRVIKMPAEDVPELDCPPGEAVGPHEGAQGVAHGPPECPPGHSDERPGRGVGPDGTPPGHGGDYPGRGVGASGSSGGGQGGGQGGGLR